MPGKKKQNYAGRFLNCPARCLFFLLVLFACAGVAGNIPEETGGVPPEEKWNTFSVVRAFPAELRVIYDGLFYPERFPLLGKLMTLFLRDKDKGYLIEQVAEDLFSIKSRKTIREGSVIQIQEMSGGIFHFSGTLVMRKGFSFTCRIKVASCYYPDGEEYKYETTVAYKAPAVVEAVDRTVLFLTGRTFVAYKVLGFVENMHAVVEALSGLEPGEWRELARDRKLLSALVYPVTFSQWECEIVEEILLNLNS